MRTHNNQNHNIPLRFQESAPAPQSTRAAHAHLAEARQAGHLVEVLVPASGLDGETPGHRVQPQPQQQPHQRQLVLLSARLTPSYTGITDTCTIRAGKSSKWAPNFSYVILGSQVLEVKIRPNQCIYSFPCTQCGCTYNYQSLCHEISLLQLLKNIKNF